MNTGSSRWVPRSVGVALGLLLCVASVAGYAWWWSNNLTDGLQSGAKHAVVQAALPQLHAAPLLPAPGADVPNSSTYLLIGDDHRPGYTRGNTDTMILARVDPTHQWISLLSLPRDMRVNIPGYGLNKLNAAYAYGGAPLLIKTIRQWLNVQVNHLAIVDFHGFQEVIHNLGGVYLPIEHRYLHVNDGTAANNYSAIDLLPGYQLVHGEQSLAWVRYRHTDSDFIRSARQQIFLREAKRQVALKAADNFVPLLKSAIKATTSDVHSTTDLINLAQFVRNLPSGRIARSVMPGDDLILNGIDYLQIGEAQKKAAVQRWLHPQVETPKKKKHQSAAKPAGPAAGINDQGNIDKSSNTAAGVVTNDFAARLALLHPKMKTCSPTVAPSGYSIPLGTDGMRTYTLNKRPALAVVYSLGDSGHNFLWMETTWGNPPILSEPSVQKQRGDSQWRWYWEGKHLRQLARKDGKRWTWITNTLGNDLSPQLMERMLRSCR